MSATTDALSGPGAAAPSASAAAPEEKIDMGKLAVFAVMTVGMFMAILDIQIVAASLPTIQAGLAASAEQISWVQTAYLIAEVIMIPASGYLSRALSTRVIFCISSAGFTLASIGCAMAWNIESLVVMRALQGCTCLLTCSCAQASGNGRDDQENDQIEHFARVRNQQRMNGLHEEVVDADKARKGRREGWPRTTRHRHDHDQEQKEHRHVGNRQHVA